MSASVKGAEELEALARRLKAAGGTELRKELLRGIRNSSKGTIEKIRASARSELPSSGGLAALVAGSKIAARTRTSGASAGITIVGTGKNVRSLRSLNEGKLRHPVFARAENRKHWAWVSQSVRPHWFDKPVEDDLPHIRTAVEKVMSDVARKIERG
jgi:hypothetical protein